MKRKIIQIDEEKCTGCGLCVPGCAEGALQIIDGKARLVSDVYCDGLGACLGECPEGALTIVEREAEEFDEHLALEALAERRREEARGKAGLNVMPASGGGCPGAAAMSFDRHPKEAPRSAAGPQPSELTHWPVQLHLVNPAADFFKNRDVVLAADCAAFALGDFHARYLKGKALAIACPKLDNGQEEYVDKIRRLADEAQINTLTVVIMQVPCCRGLMQIASTGLSRAKRKVPLKMVVVGIKGEVLSEDWV